MKKIFLFSALLLTLFVILEGVGYYLASVKKNNLKAIHNEINTKRRNLNILKEKNRILKNQIEGLSPSGIYIIVDTAKNTLYLKDGDKTIREAVISSGSGNILEDPSGKRRWVFDTPRGEFSVQLKKVNPDWIKPDWAFIEEGEPIPKEFKERVESGVLGMYALGFGNSYLIHGTLYTRLLGRNITHGCIRVGDEDLEAIFKATPMGAKIIIF